MEYSQTHTHTRTRFTQVRGPREEVRPLLLLLDLIYVVTNRVTEGLLELYPGYWKIRQVFFLSVDRPPFFRPSPSRRRAWGTLYSGAPSYSVKHDYCGHTPRSPADIGAAAPCRGRVSACRHGLLCSRHDLRHASHCYPAPPGPADTAEAYPVLDSRAAWRRALLSSVSDGSLTTARDSLHPA